jgi:hypothetical protein
MLPKMRLQHGQCLNERHGMGKLGFEPADEAGGVKPPLTPETSPLKAGAAHLQGRSRYGFD